ncbi:MAG TPA: ThiF family adenylyltransferase [Bryobacteraceae bacterium]|nr:ThiF family adenylyltransferase [Bryobacteraceae bacterium]
MTPDDLQRYSRQIRFGGIGDEGQRRLLGSRVAIVGCGALGSFQAGALARAGVGTLVLIDRDYVELSNLQRQWLYTETDAAEGSPKAIAAARAVAAFNSSLDVQPVVRDLTSRNADELLAHADLILDGTDNFETRYLINDYCIANDVPWIYGAAVGSYGLVMPILPNVTSCLACVYPEAPSGAQPTCETAGVLGPVTSAVASLQCAMALKLLAGGEPRRAIITVDVWDGPVRTIQQPDRDPSCRACGRRDWIYLSGSKRAPVSLCGRNAVQIHERTRPVDLVGLRAQLEPLGIVRANEFALRFFTDPYELTVFPDGRAIIKGTQDVGVARSLYARYIGS